MPDNAFPRAGVALEGALEAALRQQSALEVEDQYRGQLAASRALDASAGRALHGPHRSDLQVSYEAKNMPASACSTGEQKALLVGLILAQARSVAARIGEHRVSFAAIEGRRELQGSHHKQQRVNKNGEQKICRRPGE